MPRNHRLAAWLACMTVAVCSVGVPLPARTVKKSSEPFPCQHCACGCKDAETCWRDCCCHTNREKLAWARKHGVTPPAFVLAAARRENCCDKVSPATCCSSKIAKSSTPCARGERCCGDRRDETRIARRSPKSSNCPHCGDDAETSAHENSHDRSDPGVVLLISKLRCGGISLSVSLLPPSVVTLPTTLTIDLPAQYALSIAASHLYQSPYLSPAIPPPEVASA